MLSATGSRSSIAGVFLLGKFFLTPLTEDKDAGRKEGKKGEPVWRYETGSKVLRRLKAAGLDSPVRTSGE